MCLPIIVTRSSVLHSCSKSNFVVVTWQSNLLLEDFDVSAVINKQLSLFLLQHGVSQESVVHCSRDKPMKDIVFEIASQANTHLNTVRFFSPSDFLAYYLKKICHGH